MGVGAGRQLNGLLTFGQLPSTARIRIDWKYPLAPNLAASCLFTGRVIAGYQPMRRTLRPRT